MNHVQWAPGHQEPKTEMKHQAFLPGAS